MCLFASLASFLGAANALAQPGLGAPIVAEPVAHTCAPAHCRVECKQKPCFPILAAISRRVMTPLCAAHHRQLHPKTQGESPTREELARMISDGNYSPAEITVAKIKLEESQVIARRAAVKYLGLVDCYHYPEAEMSLIAALRTDRSEIIRLEAALAVGSGRTLTDRLIEALNIASLGLDLDGHPAEPSPRVRQAARESLQRCAARGLCLPPLADQALAPIDWPLPEFMAIQPATYAVPAFVPTQPPPTQRDRDIAESVSVQAKANAAPRTLLPFLHQLKTASGSESRNRTDSRMQGLRPIGSDSLSMPTTLPSRPYN
jgi:hypothetical protein